MAVMEYPGKCDRCIHINEDESDPTTPCGQCKHSHLIYSSLQENKYFEMYEEVRSDGECVSSNKLTIHGAICDEIKKLYERKNADYGDSFGHARNEIPYYTLGKLYDKFNRYKNLTINGEQTARVDESLEDTLMDLANYCIMELTERRYEKASGKNDCT